MMTSANNNVIPMRPMTPMQIARASAFCLFDLVLIGVFSQPGVWTPIVILAWIVTWAYAFLLAAQVYDSAECVTDGLKQGVHSRSYAMVMTSRPMPPMILSAISVGMILSLAIFSFYDAGIVGIIPSGLLFYTGLASAMIYAHRMRYHATVERQISYDRQAAPINPNPQKTHVSSGTKPHCHGMGKSSQSDR